MIDFNEPVAAGSVATDDLDLNLGTVTSAQLVDADSVRYTVSGLIKDGVVSYSLKAGAVTDVHGNPGPSHAGSFVIDDPLVDRFVSGDVPIAITDNTTIVSTLTINDTLTIADVDVQLNVSHTYAQELDAFLIAPDGTRIELFTRVGSAGDDFIDTVFDDEASQSITTANAPFLGVFQPEGLLSSVDGFSAQGT